MRLVVFAALLVTIAPAAAQPAPKVPTPGSETTTIDPDEAPAIPNVRPPKEIRKWFIEGELLDDHKTLRAFLAPLLDNEQWSPKMKEEKLDPLLLRLGYRGVARTRTMRDGGISLVLSLEPVTTVRYIVVDIEANAIDRFREPIFADEVQRRMTLRPGAALARSLADRGAQLRKEADRLARFLRNDGFFDAKIRIEERPVRGDRHSAKLTVIVTPGSPYKIGELTVVGNTAVEAKEVVEKFKHSRWCAPLVELCFGEARFTRSTLNRDVDRVAELYQKRGYPGVRVRTDFSPAHSFKRDTKTVEFTVEIRERRKIDVVFEGNSKYSDERLREQLTLAEEGSYDDVEVEASAASLRRFYQTQGYFEATVTWQRVKFGLFERIIFAIDRGPQLKVRRISFSGNKRLSSSKLRDVIKTKEFKRIIIGESGGFATTLQLKQDVERVLRAYAERGYLDVGIDLRVARSSRADANAAALAAAVASGMDAEGLYIHFSIDEGTSLTVKEVKVDYLDVRSVAASSLLSEVKLRAGRPFRESVAKDDARSVRRRYRQEGFPRAKVEASWERVGKDGVVITYRVTEGTPARIGKVLVRGNYKTKDWVIRDEMYLEEGQPLTLGRTDRAQGNLRKSGLFSSVKIDYLGEEDVQADNVNVLVQVEESQDVRAILSVGGGWSTDAKGFVETGATIPNLIGIGADFATNAQYGQEIKSAQGTLTLPRWIMRRAMGTPFSWNLTGFARRQLTQRFGELDSYGGSVSATKRGTTGFFDGWIVSLRYDYRQRNRDENLVRPTGRSDDLSQSPVRTTVSAFGPVLIIDERTDAQGNRNPLAPTKGWRVELRTSFAEDYLLGSNRFIKIGANGQHFWSFAKRFRLFNGIRYDHGIPLGDDVLLPEVERFFAGGDVTVRGFEEDQLATEVIETSVPPAMDLTRFRVRPAGGNIRMIYNLDLELIAYRGETFSWASAVFLDTGLVVNSLDGFRPPDLRHSIGLALTRWVTPFGSLSVEWAIPLDLDATRGDNPRGRWHFNFGILFN